MANNTKKTVELDLAFMKDQTCEVAIESTIGYMNMHLQLLGDALRIGDSEVVKFQKSQLSKIRQHLIDLDYFPVVQEA